MDYSLPGLSVHGIIQARILKRVANPFSRGSSQHRDGIQFPASQADSLLSEPCIGLLLYNWRNALKCPSDIRKWAYEEKRSQAPGSWWAGNKSPVQSRHFPSSTISDLSFLHSGLLPGTSGQPLPWGMCGDHGVPVTTCKASKWPCHPPHRRTGLSLHGTDRFLSCSSRFTLTSLSHSTMLARCQWGRRFTGSYLILNTGHLLSPSRPSRTPCCLQCCRLDRSSGHSQGSRVLSEAPGKWGRWTSPVSSLIFLKPWQLVPSSYLSWILRILLFTDLCIGKDKRGRVKKGRNTW